MKNKFIYLDYQATTPCDPRVLEKMLPYFTEHFGNPHSKNHEYGWVADEAVQCARNEIARIISADPSTDEEIVKSSEIIFTSGATESNNLAILGACLIAKKQGKNHVITSKIEHKCVLEVCAELERNHGFRVTYINVDSEGIVDIEELGHAINEKTALVSIMAASNEIGTIQPIEKIGRICRENNVLFHSDAAQLTGSEPINVKRFNIDLMSISGHKIYGPKGVGALYVSKGSSNSPRVRLKPLIYGGGQERGMRSGTLSPALCVGIGESCRIAREEMDLQSSRIRKMRDSLIKKITGNLSEVYINGSMKHRLPGNINISFACVEGESLMMALKNYALSSGSACTSNSLDPSYVLKAIGIRESLAHTSLRISIGRFTTMADIEKFSDDLINAVNLLRDRSPLWDMLQDGIDIDSIKWKHSH